MFEYANDAHSVQLWLDQRLPFEPKGEMLEARNKLRCQLKSLMCLPDHILDATYSSLTSGFFDTENILFYNVGASSFVSTVSYGLRFKRKHSAPPPGPSGRKYLHHHLYQVVPKPHLKMNRPACTLQFAVENLSSATKPHEIWWMASRAVAIATCTSLTGPFEMAVLIDAPTPGRNLAACIKPLLDGIICAFHTEPTIDEEAVRRLAAKTNWDSGAIAARLRSPTAPLLGPRHLLSCYRNFVKWNPADELCEKCTVLYRRASTFRCTVNVANIE